ncbi:hypothetical protein RHSIM_Rhsim09G0076400 [Rhododendron simsii]|uniref:Uncharacterized protein n=1 Tax=Rhododendron simsii TaxID=118357 RepID=A0A834GIC1_RHOSS|nr:hypothetical protein RHSIM_Rhsim09G0076400 [Rhododendron simsii]
MIAMADKKIKALATKVNVLAKSVAALTTIVHSLQRSSPQAPPPSPLVGWTEKAVQEEIHFAKERQGRTMTKLQPQHMDQVEGEITQPQRSRPNHTVVTNASSAMVPLNPSQHAPAHQKPTSRNPKHRVSVLSLFSLKIKVSLFIMVFDQLFAIDMKCESLPEYESP